MRPPSFDRDIEVYTSLVTDRDPIPRTDADDCVSRRSFDLSGYALDRVMAAGLAGSQEDEHQLPLKRSASRRVRNRTQCGCKGGFLLGNAATTHGLTSRCIDQLARKRIDHVGGGMGHRIGDK